MNKGFTLIELLAVIVILAIIALIATPIILNIVEDSKKSAATESAQLYADGLVKKIVSENMVNEFNPDTCLLYDGVLECDGEIFDYEISGQAPASGTLNFTNGVLSSYILCVSGYRIEKSGNNVTTTKDATCTAEPVYSTPGLYRNGVMAYTWQELIDEGLIVVYQDNSLDGETYYDYVYATAPLNGYLYIDDSIEIIDFYAFGSEDIGVGLTGVTIPNSVITISGYAFANNQIRSINIPASVEGIDYNAFRFNPLISITVDSNNPNYDSRDNCNSLIDTEFDYLFQGSKNSTIPSGIVSIIDYAFANVPITSITIPSSVADIGQGAFMDSGLTSVTIPNGISQIESETFANAPLTSITVPSSVKQLWPGSFENNQLTSATFEITDSWSFTRCGDLDYSGILVETMSNPQAIAALMREHDTCGMHQGK